MNVKQICQNYFHGFNTISNFKKNTPKTNALAILTIISYFTIVIPVGFAIVYGASSLIGRVSKKQELTAEDQKIKDYVSLKNAISSLKNSKNNDNKKELTIKIAKIAYNQGTALHAITDIQAFIDEQTGLDIKSGLDIIGEIANIYYQNGDLENTLYALAEIDHTIELKKSQKAVKNDTIKNELTTKVAELAYKQGSVKQALLTIDKAHLNLQTKLDVKGKLADIYYGADIYLKNCDHENTLYALAEVDSNLKLNESQKTLIDKIVFELNDINKLSLYYNLHFELGYSFIKSYSYIGDASRLKSTELLCENGEIVKAKGLLDVWAPEHLHPQQRQDLTKKLANAFRQVGDETTAQILLNRLE